MGLVAEQDKNDAATYRLADLNGDGTVSYTHLAVYKRQYQNTLDSCPACFFAHMEN